MTKKHKHSFKYYFQIDSLGNTHLVTACEICDRFGKFVPMFVRSTVPYEIKWRVPKNQKRKIKNWDGLTPLF